jgi:exopolysaccharide biosynthesis protein
MNFDKSRAARIALGADSEGKPILLWAEGAAKSGYIPGQGSCGASLKELAELCNLAGMKHAVNLDGGGSAQILLKNQRALQISDRDPQSFAEQERPVPLGLIIK